MKRLVLFAGALLFAAAVQAQVFDSAHLLINYVPKLNNASKINQQAVIVDFFAHQDLCQQAQSRVSGALLPRLS